MKSAAMAVLLAWAGQDKPAPVDYCAKLAPPKPIAGIAGLQSTSTIVYDHAPDRPHVLEATYVFPDRARWYMTVRGGDAAARHLEYRCGDVYFELGEGAQTSLSIERDLKASDWDPWLLKCAATELRRALFLWPDGFEWKGEGNTRFAEAACDVKLSAHLLNDRPSFMEASVLVGWDDTVIDSYTAITWQELRGRWWPKSMKLSHFFDAVWMETVDSVETSVYLLDEFFVPPDRRNADGGAPRGLRTDLPAAVTRRFALPDDCDWSRARERANELTKTEAAKFIEAGWRTDVGQWFELGEDGKPKACVLRLRPNSRAIPDGWEIAHESTALCAPLVDLGGEIERVLALLRASVPAGATAERPLVRVVAAGAELRSQLVLPLRPTR